MDQPKTNLPAIPVPLAPEKLSQPSPSFSSGKVREPPSHLDRMAHAAIGRATAGLSPASLALAYADWAPHLGMAPGKWASVMEKAAQKAGDFRRYVAHSMIDPTIEPCIKPLAQDHRFDAPAWKQWPFNFIYQTFLLRQQWWHNLTTGIGGVSTHHEHVVAFVARQLLDMVSPVNFIATNPEVIEATFREGGLNLLRGAMNLIDDWERRLGDRPPARAEQSQPGRTVAITPGKVVFRNRLIELIQYEPATQDVFAAPKLIVLHCTIGC